MKKKFTFQNILLLVLALIVTYRFSFIIAEKGEISSQTILSEVDKGFLNYVLLRPWSDSAQYVYWHITNHFSSFKELNFNGSQHYGGDGQYLGWFEQDSLNDEQRDTLERIYNLSNENGLRCFLERQRISWLCLSQRLVYEAEGGNYGFSYQRRSANIEQDSGRTVIHACTNETECPQTDATPRMLCDSIYENLQHTDLYYFHPDSSDIKPWVLKPVMRIDSNDFSPIDTTPVVAIITKNYIGNDIDTNIIRVNNFGINSYSGEYIQTYFGLQHPLQVLGRMDTVKGLNYGRPGPGDSIKACKVDFKVYWYGLVDVWFDKMIVDDTRADQLFNGLHDLKIEDEVNIFRDTIIYFVGELTSSQAYTTKYVKDKMKEIIPGINPKLQFAVSNNINLYSHRNPETRSKLLFDIVKPDLMCLDAHVFQTESDYKIYLPDNAVYYDPRIPEPWKASPNVYNTRLQNNALGNKNQIITPFQGTFIYQISKIRNDLRSLSPDTKFTVQPHLHSWAKTTGGMFEDGGFREPTNEEIQVQAALAIAHGVQSLNWECYHSGTSNNINLNSSGRSNTVYTILGLRNADSSKRTLNTINENKWEYVKAMNLKILHWKPTLDKVKWDSGYSVHYEGATHNFISDIKSILVHSSPPTACEEDNINYDCLEERYWEMGFFVPDFGNPTVDQYDKSKYFMMVNRRCVPDTPSNVHGDLRQLKIKFDSTQLQGFRNWKIIEMDSNKVIRTFDKDSNIYIDMKIFQPGEGKLYKLAPVMQEGGALAANEQVEGITFICNGPVNNNGKDISILEGTKINFKTGAGINMTGGKLTCSNFSTNTSENVLLKGYNGLWNGIVMNSCMRSVIKRTRFEDAKNCIVISNGTGGSKYTAKIIRRNYFKVTADSGKALTINNQMEMAIDSNTFRRLCTL